MRRFCTIVILFILGGSAYAADLPVKVRYFEPWHDYNWNGFYAGVGGGASAGEFKGQFGSAMIGINFQSYSNVVLGLEGDISVGKLKGDEPCSTCGFESRWVGTVRGRVGYSFGRTLLYTTLGLAMADVKSTGPAGLSENKTKFGYAIGAGAEFDLADNWSLRADYKYIDLGGAECGIACAGLDFGRVTTGVVQVALIFRFFGDAVSEFTLGGPGTKPPPPR